MPTIGVNGTTMYYELVGHGPAVLLLHGLGSSSADWQPQLDGLAADYQVCAADLRGHGHSAKPSGPYSIGLFAQDVAALMRSLPLAPAHVIGISMGGMIAFELALSMPDLVRSLVIVNSGPGLPGPRLVQRLIAAQRLLLVRWMGLTKFGVMLAERLLPGDEHAATREAFAQRFAANDPRAYRAAVKALAGWNVTDRLGAIAAPVLIVSADHDYTPVSFKQAYLDKLPRAELAIIDNARHAVTIERPHEFNQIVRRFLRSVS